MYLLSSLISVGKYRVFSKKKGKNHLIINIESGGKGELTSCPNSFVRDCSSSKVSVRHFSLILLNELFYMSSQQDLTTPR